MGGARPAGQPWAGDPPQSQTVPQPSPPPLTVAEREGHLRADLPRCLLEGQMVWRVCEPEVGSGTRAEQGAGQGLGVAEAGVGLSRRSVGNRGDISGWWGSGFSSHRHPGCRGERSLRKAGSQASALAVSVASPSQAGISHLCSPCSFGVAQGPGVLLCGLSPGQVVHSAAHRRHLPRARQLGAGGFPLSLDTFPLGVLEKGEGDLEAPAPSRGGELESPP